MSKSLFLSLALLSVPLSACDSKKDTPVAGVSKGTLELAKGLLRGELAAVATYEDVMKKNDKPDWSAQFTLILADHRSAAAKLRARVTALGGDPTMGSGAWGGWTELAAKGAAALGDEPGRAILEAGEKAGLNSYESALNDSNADAETKALIRSELLERTRAHITTLQQMKR